MNDPLTAALLEKIVEQIERTQHLIGLLPEGSGHWTPGMDREWTTAELVRHLTSCVTGFCAVLYAAEPDRLAYLQAIKYESEVTIAHLLEQITAGFADIDDASLARIVPTVFVPEGQTVLTLFLSNLEHLINHKHQLFTYLRLMKVDVRSQDLYRFR